jgi:hypothetical protein
VKNTGVIWSLLLPHILKVETKLVCIDALFFLCSSSTIFSFLISEVKVEVSKLKHYLKLKKKKKA